MTFWGVWCERVGNDRVFKGRKESRNSANCWQMLRMTRGMEVVGRLEGRFICCEEVERFEGSMVGRG